MTHFPHIVNENKIESVAEWLNIYQTIPDNLYHKWWTFETFIADLM